MPLIQSYTIGIITTNTHTRSWLRLAYYLKWSLRSDSLFAGTEPAGTEPAGLMPPNI